ncbi:Crp/Fnr family transcriptional regulator [Vibrio paucivorans]
MNFHPKDISSIIQFGESSKIKKGTTLIHQGGCIDTLYYLVEGEVSLCTSTENGNIVYFDSRLPGQFINPAQWVCNKEISEITYKATKDSVICLISKESLLSNKEYLEAMLMQVSQLLINAHERSTAYLTSSSLELIVNFIYGFPVGSVINITHEEISRKLKISRPQVTKCLRLLKEHGVIDGRSKVIRLISKKDIQIDQ